MKLSHLVLGLSIAGNVALIVAFATKPSLAPPTVRDCFAPDATNSAEATASASASPSSGAKPNASATAAAQRAKIWSSLYSGDLAGLAAKLRAAGFPPHLVRAVVSAQIEAQFESRMQALTQPVLDTPFWKPDPWSGMGSAFFDQYNQVYRERSRLLREVLGDLGAAEVGEDPDQGLRRRFGDLSRSKLELVQRITDDYTEMTNQVRAAMQGVSLPEDREKLALLEREKRADLAALLSPEELQEYELRTSTITSRLRSALTIMDASEAEFRAIFAAHDAFKDQLYPVSPSGGISIPNFNERRQAQSEANARIKAALGEERLGEFLRASEFEYQQLHRLAERENLAPDAARRAFALRETAAAESNRIYNDRQLDVPAKRTALNTLAQNTQLQLETTLGPNVAKQYLTQARWLSAIRDGAAVTVNPQGGFSTRRIAPPASQPAPRN